jgi:sugar/nucleoside kinase (ribokinase family)
LIKYLLLSSEIRLYYNSCQLESNMKDFESSIETSPKLACPTASPKVAVIGELNVDLVASGLRTAPIMGSEILADGFQVTLGSASAIFAAGVARLGHPVTFISKIGADTFGRYCLDALTGIGIPVERVRVDPGSTTGVTVSLSTKKDRALVTCLGAISELKIADIAFPALEGHSHLHMTSLFLQHALRPSFPSIFRRAHKMGLTTSFDPNSAPAQSWKPDIWDVISQTDILSVNEAEALQLTGKRSVERALEYLGAKVPCVAIKLGRRGAIAMRNKQVAFAPGFRVSAVDTTGAGDSFAAGFVHEYLAGSDLRRCLETGNACGALSTLQVGGTTGQPNCADLEAFLKKNGKQRQRAKTAGAGL